MILLCKFFICAEAWVGEVLIDKLLNVFVVELCPFGLPIGTMIATDIGTFIPEEAKPFQISNHGSFRLRCRSTLICVLHSETTDIVFEDEDGSRRMLTSK